MTLTVVTQSIIYVYVLAQVLTNDCVIGSEVNTNGASISLPPIYSIPFYGNVARLYMINFSENFKRDKNGRNDSRKSWIEDRYLPILNKVFGVSLL